MELKKFVDTKTIFLSLSQIKQIGGRAGRFGETSETDQGIVTCMSESNMPILKRAFQKQTPMLTKAIMPFTIETFLRMAEILPPTYGLTDLYNLLYLGGNFGDHYAQPMIQQVKNGMEIIDHVGSDLRLAEKVLFAHCPVTWRVDEEVLVMSKFMKSFTGGGIVDLKRCLQDTSLLDSSRKINDARLRRAENPIQNLRIDGSLRTKESLQVLETFHKVLLSYIWLSFRIPVSFAQQQLAVELKEQTEACIEFVLEGIGDRKLLRSFLKSGLSTGQVQEKTTPKISYTPAEGRAYARVKQIIGTSV